MAWTDTFLGSKMSVQGHCALENWVMTLILIQDLGIVKGHMHTKNKDPSINSSKVMARTDTF